MTQSSLGLDKQAKKDITVVIVNYNTKDDVLAAVRSLAADVNDLSHDVQITVVDNSQNQDNIKYELERQFPLVHYIDPGENVGFGKANTLGFQHSPARYYFALNRDTLIPENSNTIERIISFMDTRTNIGCIGPKLVNTDGTTQFACYRFDLPSLLVKPLRHIGLDERYKWIRKHADKLQMKDFDRNATQPVDWVLGAAMVVRDEVVDDIGWFDERYFMYLEDCDWCKTMWEHGWPVYYVHDIEIQHAHARGSAQVPGVFKALFKNKLARIHLKSWLQYLWKWRGRHKYYGKI